MSFWKIDLHCHTSASYDGWTRPAELIARARQAGLDRVCITDHGNMRGARAAKVIAPDLVIPGIEIRCKGGTEVIGVGVVEPIPDGLEIELTASRIKEQGGLVYAPHPFAYLRNANYHAERVLAVTDIVECFNPRAFMSSWNRDAEQAARLSALPVAASSDAHFPWEIGRAWTEVAPFYSMGELKKALAVGRPAPQCAPGWSCHLLSVTLGATRRLRWGKKASSG